MANKVFITGSSGILGEWVVQEFNARKISFDRYLRKSSSSDSINVIYGTLSDLDILKSACKENVGIVHMACATLTDKTNAQVDIDAMEVLLQSWKQGPFTFISSLDVYGFPENCVVAESHPYSYEIGAYAKSKIECEKMLIEHSKKIGNGDYTILRAPWIFAPSDKSRAHIERRFLKGKESEILLPSQEYKATWIDARELASIIGMSLSKPLSGAGNPLNSEIKWEDFFKHLKELTSATYKITVKERALLPSEIQSLFGKKCSYSGVLVANHFNFKPVYDWKLTLQQAFKN